ncbi:GMC oxidoreductase [Actinomadura sp. DC4]|uniref:GMC family oxidoreductase n=1 Tax=Actinomadura sp. DC4 TaxID=3055069 RepID=UPI0025AF29C1|nr:GMC oxidoreductase [Actinomadura sp. DC4]MDN3357820.1 GMC family oxidoreductase N-terminal domain-containing protein [Actinomadura sp. DC4]
MRTTHFNVLIVGGGAAGCVLANRLSEDERTSVGLVEAGPDYGRFDVRRWPAELLDARVPARGHDWDAGEPCCARARVIGGSSAHNGCWATLGAPPDYDAWSPYSRGTLNDRTLRPHLHDAMRTLRVRPAEAHDRTPWHEAVVETAGRLGLPFLEDVNDETGHEGAGWVPLNAVGSVRWHAGFAYLDPARDRPNLQVIADSHAARLEFAGDRATGLVTVGDGGERRLSADVIALCCGTYGNPPLLMRSGVGPERALRDLGAPVTQPLPGVGANLIDHGSLALVLDPLPGLAAAMPDAAESYFAQTLVKARSSLASDEYWDVHMVPAAGPALDARGRYTGPMSASLHVYVMAPRSRGAVRAASLDPMAPPRIDHGFFTDPAGHDERVVLEAIDLAHEFAGSASLAGLAGLTPWGDGRRAHSAVLADASGYWHPVGTCAMGPEADPLSVADERGRVHGLANVYVADASLMPLIPRANTHLTTIAVADRLGGLLAGSLGGRNDAA